MTDLVTFGETMLRLSPPDHQRLEAADEFVVHVAGAESNVAVAAQRLGLDATWLSKLPDSPLGRKVTGALGTHGVDAAVAWADEGRQGTYYVEAGGEPRGTNVIYDRADAAVTTATPEELPTAPLREADAFHTTGITPALSATLESTVADLLATAGEAGTTRVFDVNYRSKLWSPAEARATLTDLLPAVDVLVVAERDARNVLGRDGGAAAVADGLAAEFDLDLVLVTRGEEGALALADGTTHEQPVFPAEDVDPVGTGDAFVGGFLSQWLRDADVPTALEYGAATASLKRTIPGDVAMVTEAEVERVVESGAGGGINR